ncbi:MAG: hypothetical protein M3P96_06210, partial [Actinomycetota bacterium]|nr:hypothetical protein [Actinomycetota bacterium]
ALAVPGAAAPVRAQAQQLLGRLPGPAHEDLLVVLDEEPRQHWPGVVREEVLRLGDVPARERLAGMTGFVDGLLRRPDSAYELAQSLLHVLLELPPAPYEDMVTAVVLATAGRPGPETGRVQAVVRSAMARFPVPQWQRLAATFDAAATRAGSPAGWT